MTNVERGILKDLGVQSLGLYTSKIGPVIAVHLIREKDEWEEKEIKKYVLTLIPGAIFL